MVFKKKVRKLLEAKKQKEGIRLKKVKDWDEVRGISADMSDKELEKHGYRKSNWDDDIAEKQVMGKLSDAIKGFELPVHDWKRVTKSNLETNAQNYAETMLADRSSGVISDKERDKYMEQYKELMKEHKPLPKSYWQKLVKLHKKHGAGNSKKGEKEVEYIYKKAGKKQ